MNINQQIVITKVGPNNYFLTDGVGGLENLVWSEVIAQIAALVIGGPSHLPFIMTPIDEVLDRVKQREADAAAAKAPTIEEVKVDEPEATA